MKVDQVEAVEDASPGANHAQTLLQLEAEAISKRRRSAGVSDALPTVGLALSGGGIRSATFCLGLIRGLAQNKLLSRIDYLSTVSGGGYLGGAVGRLISVLGLEGAQRELAAGGSPTLSWLRRYGRYLAPRGARDLGIGAASYLRAALAIHLELAVLCILLACLVVLPHALQLHFNVFDSAGWTPSLSVWWPLAVGIWLFISPALLAGYWAVRDPDQTGNASSKLAWTARLPTFLIAIALVSLFSYLTFFADWDCPGNAADDAHCQVVDYLSIPLPALSEMFMGLVVLASSLIGILVAQISSTATRARQKPEINARLRRALTEGLRLVNLITLVLLALGALDRFTWYLREMLTGASWLVGGTGLGALVALLGRGVLAPLQQVAGKSDRPRLLSMKGILGALGLLSAAVIFIGWTTLVQHRVFPPGLEDPRQWRQQALDQIALASLVALAWIVITSLNRESTNASSLHSFYRARLTRAYLRVGNPEFHSEAPPSKVRDVTAIAPDDDVPLGEYAPDIKGGPLHLINTCLNQTRSRMGSVYNADRKGHRLTASRLGLEVGEDWRPAADTKRLGSLGEWVAMSGAAAAPGAGSYSSLGWALLLFMGGVRLGRWFPSLEHSESRAPNSGDFGRWLRDLKYGRLSAEAMARFSGGAERAWYVSDGGHFENTGAHALIRREVDFILLADCGADPGFALSDLENLVRKARIDYDAEIEFYSSQAAQPILRLADADITVLSPDELRQNFSARGALMARITYRGGKPDPKDWKQGTLLVIKPNLHECLDPDVLAYASRNAKFPQESTGDQFFDEAQWESYHRLGEDFGRALTADWLAQLPAWSSHVPLGTTMPKIVRLKPAAAPSDTKPFWRPEARAAALGATVSLGALAAIALPTWQAVAAFQQDRENVASLYEKNADAAELAAPAWLRLGLTPSDSDLKRPNRDGPSTKLSTLYEDLVRQRATERDHVPGVRLISTIQNACQIERVGGRLRQACPLAVDNKPICQVVCDRELGDSYWIHPVGDSTDKESTRAVSKERPATPTKPPALIAAYGLRRTRLPPIAEQAAPPPTTAQLCGANPITLYIQVYSEATRSKLASVVWSDVQVRVPGVENVVATAAAKGRSRPSPWEQPTLVIHDLESDGSCARGLATWLSNELAPIYETKPNVALRQLPASLASERGIIELWVPDKLKASN